MTERKQKPLKSKAGTEDARNIRVWIDGREITNDCSAFDTEEGWADVFTGSQNKRVIITVAGKKQVEKNRLFGKITYTRNGDPCYV